VGCFHPRARGRFTMPSAELCYEPGSSLRAPSLRRVPSRLHPRSKAFRPELRLPRFRALLATSRPCSHFCEESQLFATSVLRLSQPLDVFFRTTARGLVPSRCHVQGPLVQGLLTSRSHPPSSGGACPLAVRTATLTGKPALHIAGPRLRGLHLRGAAFTLGRLFTAHPRSLPSSSCSPPGPPQYAFRPSLPRTFRSRRWLQCPSLARSAPSPVLSVCSAYCSVAPSPARPTCSRFRA